MIEGSKGLAWTVKGGVKAERHAFGAHASLDISSWKPEEEREREREREKERERERIKRKCRVYISWFGVQGLGIRI